jgi:hypothetical protein
MSAKLPRLNKGRALQRSQQSLDGTWKRIDRKKYSRFLQYTAAHASQVRLATVSLQSTRKE